MTPLPAVADVVPLHVLTMPGTLATSRPAGRLSANATPVRDEPALGFVIVKLTEVLPLSGIEGAPNDFTMLGANCAVAGVA
jgi:hypothetical protein